MKSVIIDGAVILDLSQFYNEVEKKLTFSLNWKIGRNLDAFNDILRGGFGVHEYGEKLELIWKNHNISKSNLGRDETIKYIQLKLKSCHPTNISSVLRELELVKEHKGETLFQIIIKIIIGHENIVLRLE
jgi:RNAse (barnase) inhibitor barstar